MKKYFFFALAAAGLLSSCSSDDTVAGTEVENDELVPIQIGFGGGSVSVDETRGTGTVGGYQATEENKWHSQKFNVYMLKKGTMEIAQFEGADIYKNQLFTAPGTAFAAMGDNPVGPRTSGIARPDDNKIKYYPTQDNFDFFAYRLDDATSATPAFVGDSLSVDFTINGSQDILVAKAIPTTADINTLKAINGNAANADRYYSSFSARHGVQPNLNFKHLLTRLTFQVMPKGNSTDATSHIVIDAIKVVAKKTKGTLTIAKVGDNNGDSQKITWYETTAPVELALMQRDSTKLVDPITNIDSLALIAMNPFSFKGLKTDTAYAVGEALLLAPETEYELKVYGHQEILDEYGETTTHTNTFVYTDKIQKPSQYTPLMASSVSYNVIISLWGVSNISINAELNGWTDGSAANMYFEPEETKINGFAD